MAATEGMERGQEVTDQTGKPISVPVGPETLRTNCECNWRAS